MLLSRYREGFERLSIVAFVVCAVGFGLARLTIADAAGGADDVLERRIAGACAEDNPQVLHFLCRQSILAEARWARLRDNAGTSMVVVLAVVAVLGTAFFGRRAYRWVRRGFTTE